MKTNIETNADKYNKIEKFIKEYRQNIVENGLDQVLTFSLENLKKELFNYINNINIKPTRIGEKLPENELGQQSINPPKSERDLLFQLTKGKVDLSKYNSSKSFSQLSETGLLVGFNSKNQEQANRVTLRMEINSTDTVEQHYQAATKFINEAVFALPDTNGKLQYYSNPGYDLTPFVKIKCSTQTGSGNGVPQKGISPYERFEKDKTRKRRNSDTPYAEWTLKQEAVGFIRNNFVNLTPILADLQVGDVDRAEQLASFLDQENKTNLKEQVSNFKQNKDVPQEIANYKNIIDIINSLKWSKKTTEKSTTYKLISSASTSTSDTDDAYENLKKTIKQWVAIEKKSWIQAFEKKLRRLIGKYS